MNRVLRQANKRVTWGGAAALLIFSSMFGQVLGFLRVKLINANFDEIGPQSTDAFFAAFKIPDFFFYTVAAGALGVVFIPIIADHLERNDRKGAWELSTSLLNLLAIATALIGLVILIFAEPLMHVVAPGLGPDQMHNAVIIMRLIAFNPLLFTVSGIITAVQQTMGRFFFFAVAPLFYNLCIIISIFLFRDNIGIVGLGIGALAGAVLQLFIAAFGLKGIGFRYRPTIMFRHPDFRRILRQLPPRSIDQGIDSINSIVETNFGSRLGTANITYYENAYVLHTAPIQLIGNAISTAAFPRLTEQLAKGNRQQFQRDFLRVVRILIWISVPVVVISFFGRAYLARMIFARGAPEIAVIFGFLSMAIFFRILYTMFSRYFYAQKDTWTPLAVSIFAIALNIVLAWVLSNPERYGVAGLALAQSIVAAAEVAILFLVMVLQNHGLFDRYFWSGVWRVVSITGFSVVATYIMVQFFPLGAADRGFITLGFKLGMIASVTLTVHLTLSNFFGLEEAAPVMRRLQQARRLVFRPVQIRW